MSSGKPPKSDNDSGKQGHGSPTPSVPTWRFAQMPAAREPPEVHKYNHNLHFKRDNEQSQIIDKRQFFDQQAKQPEAITIELEKDSSNFVPTQLRPVPAFYPLEKSCRFVDDSLAAVAARISDCLRVLSVQAIYNNETVSEIPTDGLQERKSIFQRLVPLLSQATANLMTSENVEMHLSLWRTNGGKYPDGIIVELQRRKGCSMTFHRYSRYVLDAAMGDFDGVEHIEKYGEDMDRAYSKKVQRLLNMEACRSPATEQENAIIAIEIAHGLLMKDRMDARQLGLESLCLLTDPRKTSPTTAMIASQVVLLGTARGVYPDEEDEIIFDEAPFQEIRETILSLVQFHRIGDEADFGDVGEGYMEDLEGEMEGDNHPEEREHIGVLHNLALAVLANALDVIENEERYDDEPEETDKMPAARGRARTESASSITSTFMNAAKESSNLDILSTLIHELGKAEKKPHNACLSAKCIGSLCRASEDARRRAKELGAKNVVKTALEVGVRTHLKLETECKKVVKAINLTTEEDQTN